MKGKVFLLCDTDDKLESDTSHIKQDSQHPKLKYRRLIVDENKESVQLVEVNSNIAAKPTVLEDVLNGFTFIKTLDFFKDDNPELNSIIYETNRIDVQGKEFYPSALSLKLSVAEAKELKNFFKKHNTFSISQPRSIKVFNYASVNKSCNSTRQASGKTQIFSKNPILFEEMFQT